MKIVIHKAKYEYLYTNSGKKLIDLFSAHGAVSLGHNPNYLVKALKKQASKIWLSGGLPATIQREASELLTSFFPDTHKTKIFYSTGMEAVEFALRVAKVHTAKRGIISFSCSMHGKSGTTAALSWDNFWQDSPTDVYRLPSLREATEKNILKKIKSLADKNIAAIIIEPYQCSNGGFSFSQEFYLELVPFCKKNKILIIFDEILTGFYRTGSLFAFSKYKFVPDIILLGKSLGNGFPVSAVVMRKNIEIKKEMLPRSTFADNPLAAAVVVAVLKQYKKKKWDKKVEQISQIIQEQFMGLARLDIKIRGSGACWILELPVKYTKRDFTNYFIKKGLAINQVNNFLRLLPPLIIKPQCLKKACLILKKEISKLLLC